MSDYSGCVICGREADHGYLDDLCFSRLSSMLRQIEDEAAMLDARPSMAIRLSGGKGGLASQQSPVVLDAIVARDPRRGDPHRAWLDVDPWGLDDTASVLETLDSRCRMAHEEGGFDLPAANVSACRDFLTKKLDWIARQPWVDEFFKDLLKLLIQLQRTNKTQDDRPVGFCHLPRLESTCGGRIWQREQDRHVWRVKGDRCVREKVKITDGPAYCERCRAQWDGKELARLRLIEEQRQAEAARPKTEDGRRMLTAQEMADRLGTTVVNVRKMASRQQIRAVLGHYDPDRFAVKASA